jgi:transcriptional regulator with XRE-family HTH domain
MDRKELGDKIRFVRRRKQRTQQNMADALGMSSAKQYGRHETGEARTDMELLEKIAEEFEMTVPELLSYDEAVSFKHCIQHHVLGSNNTYHESSEKVREQYEARIAEQRERIKHLEGEVAFLREQLARATRER